LQGYLLGHPLPAEGFMADIQSAEQVVRAHSVT
jgi:EAL domain-containing protein (putative c-di-GMP-specific phosphodiesterase class I)